MTESQLPDQGPQRPKLTLAEVVDLSGAMVWPFRGDPYVPVGKRTHVPVDPFPAYAHDAELVQRCINAAVAAFPVEHTPTIYLLDREPPVRTNGWAEPESNWNPDIGDDGAWVPTAGRIVLAGKRIPLHPAMTRYLVAHEYGHHVEWHIAYQRTRPTIEYDVLKAEYQELRGLDEAHRHATGGTWHKSVVDVFADDFRLLVAQAETEFWPHPGVPRPEDVPEVVEWWERALDERAWTVTPAEEAA